MIKDLIKTILQKQLEDKKLFYPFIRDLDNKESTILRLREQNKTLEEIGIKFYITRERVRQIEMKAKDKLEYRRKVIDILVNSLAECLFDEGEFEEAFLEYLPKSYGVADSNLEWVKLKKIIWKNKKTNEKIT